jgi:hypothetical protein
MENLNLEEEQRTMRELLTRTMQEFGSIDQKPKPKKSAWEGKGLKI